ncbi:hypothetical protein [Archangium lipolyticum]|uniref:hypothetical protein n=1 Tax=Archangium lipolyticum TaxID=2970465 RepID=UPI002149AA8F|nr:hypothetical protein [Archangium lipolyticum]
MDELEQFEAVLRELGELLLDLADLSSRVMLIGGQVLALESRKRGRSGMIEVETDTGEVVPRGFTLEPDLLFDLDGTVFMAGRLLEVLRERGYSRVRNFRWSKPLGETSVNLDLFAPAEVDPEELPTFMTPLPDARLVLRRQQPIELTIGDRPLRVAIPDAVGFLAMKTRAKLELRPDENKDSFDIFAYVKLVGAGAVLDALQQAGQEGWDIQKKLLALFFSRSSPGVRDVVAYANSFDPEQQELLAQSVVDLFAEF